MADERAGVVAEQVLAALPAWGGAVSQLNVLVADRMGVTTTDLNCLDTLNRHGPATASELAGAVGLTPGSVSRMIDRLDAAGCITRNPDPHDRRRVLIEPTAEGIQRVRSYYTGLIICTREDLSEFSTAELKVIQRFIDKTHASTTAALNRLRGPTVRSGSARPTS